MKEGKTMGKSKILAGAAAAALALSLCGCAGQQEQQADDEQQAAQEQQAAPVKAKLSLDGSWKQVNASDPDTSHMEATIEGDAITVKYITNSGDTESLFWQGTYAAPDTTDDSYSFTSERDQEATKNMLLASTDDTKDFEYADGTLSFKMTMMGTTATIKMERA